MKTNLLLISFFFFLSACAHTKDTLKSLHAFYFFRSPGTIAVDANGMPQDKRQVVYAIYFEGKDSLESASVRVGQNNIVPTCTLLQSFPHTVGIVKASGKKRLLQPSPGNKLWKLYFVTEARPDTVAAAAEMVLKGSLRKKFISQSIKNLTELASPAYQ